MVNLAEIKRYDDSVWLYILKQNTVFDTENIKAQKDWLIKSLEAHQEAIKPRPIDEWHEDDGDCLWWKFPIEEPPYCGSPLAEDWPEYHTHFTRIMLPLSE